MNKIFKVVKNRSTGLYTVVSELAKGAKKGSLTVSAFVLAMMTSLAQAASVAVPQDYNPLDNDDGIGKLTFTQNTTVDLGLGKGFASAEKGRVADITQVTANVSISDLYRVKYVEPKAKLAAATAAGDAYNAAEAAYTTADNNFTSADAYYESIRDDESVSEADKQAALNARQAAFDQREIALNNKQTALDEKNTADAAYTTATTAANNITDEQFKVTDDKGVLESGGEVARLQGYANVFSVPTYIDVITGQRVRLRNAYRTLEVSDTTHSVSGSPREFFFWQHLDDQDQYTDIKMLEIKGAGNTLDVVNTGDADNGKLDIIAKKGGIIDVVDGANLNYNTQTSYFMGSAVSQQFDLANEYISDNTVTLYEIQWVGTVDTALGTRTINNADDFNQFNRDLIRFIQTDAQIRIEHGSQEKMEAFYKSQMDKVMGETVVKGSFNVHHKLTKQEILDIINADPVKKAQYENRVTGSHTEETDVGLRSYDNYFIGVMGSGSTVTVAEGAKITAYTADNGWSAGTAIKGDFENSGKDAQNIYNIHGEVSANPAILVNNAKVLVSETGKVGGTIKILGGDASTRSNSLDVKGKISSSVIVDNGKITNYEGSTFEGNVTGLNTAVHNLEKAKIQGNIDLGNNSEVVNKGFVTGYISVGQHSKVDNKNGSVVGGMVRVGDWSELNNAPGAEIRGLVVANGPNAIITNNGTITGTVNAVNGAKAQNNASFVSEGRDNIVTLEQGAQFKTNGDIYIGYKLTPATDTTPESIDISKANILSYTAMTIGGKDDKNNSSLFRAEQNGTNYADTYLAGNQINATLIKVIKDGTYQSVAGTTIVLNQENLKAVSGTPADETKEAKVSIEDGHNNTALRVEGEGATANIAGDIIVKDSGSTAVMVKKAGQVTLTGNIDLSSQNVDDTTAVRSFGIYAEGEGSQVTLAGNSTININGERAIGVHVRDNASVEIKDTASVSFGSQKNQLGFLISGVSSGATTPAIVYNSTGNVTLNGEGSTLFRVERGSVFDSNTVGGTGTKPVLSTNNTKDATIVEITTGAVATGANWRTHADFAGLDLQVGGEGARGLALRGGATATIDTTTTFNVSGEGAVLAEVDGRYFDLSGNLGDRGGDANVKSTLTSRAELKAATVSATNSRGYLVRNGGKLDHYGTIDFSDGSKNNVGIEVVDGGELASHTASKVEVKGYAVRVSGNNSAVVIDNQTDPNPIVHGIGTGKVDAKDPGAAYHLMGASNLTLKGTGKTLASAGAHAILVDGASRIVLDGTTLDVTGVGNGIENRSALDKITFTNGSIINIENGIGIHSGVGFSSEGGSVNGVINVNGSGTGIVFEKINETTGKADGNTDEAIHNTGFQNVVINVNGAAGKGIVTRSTKDVTSSASVNIKHTAGSAALIVEGTSQTVKQHGNLRSASESGAIVQLDDNVATFINEGSLLHGTFSTDSDGNTSFTEEVTNPTKYYAVKRAAGQPALAFGNTQFGRINGKVELLGGAGVSGNTVVLASGSQATAFETGDANDTFTVDNLEGTDADTAAKRFTQLDGGAGTDTLRLTGGLTKYELTKDDTIQNIEIVEVSEGSLVIDRLANMITGVEQFKINNAKLTYNKDADAEVTAKLEGAGQFIFNGDVANNTARHKLDFTGTANDAGSFTGTMSLKNAEFDLSDGLANAKAVKNTALAVQNNSLVNVTGENTIRALLIGESAGTVGARINFGAASFASADSYADVAKSSNHLNVTSFAIHKGEVQLNGADAETLSKSSPLMEQDDAGLATKLVSSANTISGNIANLKLIDEHGNEITSARVDYEQTGNAPGKEQAARVSYKVGFNTGEDNKGLYVSYGLEEIELRQTGDNGLKLNAEGKSGKKAELQARLTNYVEAGETIAGDLQITGGEVTLTNPVGKPSAKNDYIGATLVKNGATLVANSTDALGRTNALTQAAGTTVKFTADTNNTVGALNTVVGATTNLNGGTLTLKGKQFEVDADGKVLSATETINADSTIAGALTGAGNLVFEANTATVTGSNAALSAKVQVGKDDSTQATVKANKMDSLGTGELAVKADATVEFALAADAGTATLANTLTGSGKVVFDGDSGSTKTGTALADSRTNFNLAANNTGAFTGTVELHDANLNLSGANTTALTNATLVLKDNTRTEVGEGKQVIGNLEVAGGMLDFKDVALKAVDPAADAARTIKVTDLNLASGSVQVGLDKDKYNQLSGLSILEQDDDTLRARLIEVTGTITGNAETDLALLDSTGNALPKPSKTLIKQETAPGILTDVARTSYMPKLAQDANAVYLEAGLTLVELIGKGEQALDLNADGKSGKKAELSAKVSDYREGGSTVAGDVQITDGVVTLTNLDAATTNDYTGATIVRNNATLRAGADSALGDTRELKQDAGSTFDLNAKTQAVGALNTEERATTNLNGGTLTVEGKQFKVATSGTVLSTSKTENADSTIKGALTGAGNLVVEANTVTVEGSNDTLSAKVQVGKDDSTQATVKANKIDSLGTGDVDVKAKSLLDITLAVADTAGVTLANKLKGTGKVTFNGDETATSQTAFAFAENSNTGGTFEGTVQLNNAKLDLSGVNTDALTNATLRLSDKTNTTVGEGSQRFKGLETENNAVLDFAKVGLKQGNPIQNATHHIHVDNLTLGDTIIRVDLTDSGGSGTTTGLVGGLSLLEQDNDSMRTRLMTSENALSKVGTIKLQDRDGNDMPDPTLQLIAQNGTNVARASYGTSLTHDANHVDLSVGLTKVELMAKLAADGSGEALKLDATGKSGKDAELTVQVTDYTEAGVTKAGDLQIVGSGTVTMNNDTNSYRGRTLVKDTATLKAGSNNALGRTNELNQAAGTTFDLNAKTQAVGALNTAVGATTNLNGGSLTVKGKQFEVDADGTVLSATETIDADSTIKGALTGAGNLVVEANTVTVEGSNATLSANVQVGKDDTDAGKATVKANKIDSLGTGDVDVKAKSLLDITLAAAETAGVTLANKLKGTGKVTFNGDETATARTAFDFDAKNVGDFKGTLALTNATTNLLDVNTAALSNATLVLEDNSFAQVGDGVAKAKTHEVTRTIKATTLAGGTLGFGDVNLGAESTVKRADNNLSVTNFTIAEASGVQADVVVDADTGLVAGLALLQQDDVADGMKARLVTSANKITDELGNELSNLDALSLKDKDGNPAGQVFAELKQNAEVVAKAIYDKALSLGDGGKAIDLTQKLTEVQLKVKGDNALILNPGDNTGEKAKLTVKVTDYVNADGSKTAGDLQIVGGEVTLANPVDGSGDLIAESTNDYTGVTYVRSGAALVAGSDTALGNTSQLNQETSTLFNLGSYKQTVGSIKTVGTAFTQLGAGSVLTVAGNNDMTTPHSSVAGRLVGAGSLVLNAGRMEVLGSNAAGAMHSLGSLPFSGTTTIGADDSTEAAMSSNHIDSLGVGDVIIRKLGTWAVTLPAALTSATLQNKLIGTGTFDFNGDSTGTAKTKFDFGAKNVGDFEGTAKLQNATFSLADGNTTALSKAKLVLAQNTVTTVGAGEQAIRALSIEGGQINFDNVKLYADDPSLNSDDYIRVNDVSWTTGKINVNFDSSGGLFGGLSLLQQDNTTMRSRLIRSTEDVISDVTQLALVEKNGDPLKPVKRNITQSTVTPDLVVARASYDVGLAKSTDDKGVDVTGKLVQVELKTTKAVEGDALVLDGTGKSGEDAKLTAKLTNYVDADTGDVYEGDLRIKGTGEVTLANTENDYRGITFVEDTATLIVSESGSLGKTKGLEQAANTKAIFDKGGALLKQTLGAIKTGAGALTKLVNTELTLSGESDSVIDGTLEGTGTIKVNKRRLAVSSSSKDLSADIELGDDVTGSSEDIVTADISQYDALGKGAIKLNKDAVLTLTQDDDGSLANRVINSDADDQDAVFNKKGAGTLTLSAEQAQYVGETNLSEGGLVLNGENKAFSMKSHTINVAAGTRLAGVDGMVVDGQLNNHADVYVGHRFALGVNPAETNTTGQFTVGGYEGFADSQLIFNSDLGGDASPATFFKVTGNTSGESKVLVNNIAGIGAETSKGIKIVEVGGDSDAVFSLAKRTSAGAYDYRLLKKGSDWYLDSKGGFRPEVGAYLANLTTANSMFDMRLHDRMGEPVFMQDGFAERSPLWAMIKHNNNESQDSKGYLDMDTKYHVLQLGSDIVRWTDKSQNLYNVGLTAGYGNSKTHVHNFTTGFNTKGGLTGYSVGAYATMYANNPDRTGLHVDTWVLWNSFKGHVYSGQKNNYDLKGITASVEVGHTSKLGSTADYDVFVQPKVQVTWSGVKAQETLENGHPINGQGKNLRTRVGVKVFANSKASNFAESVWQPFAEVNWIRNSNPYYVSIANTDVKQGGINNIGEVKLGVERKSSKHTDLWLNAGYQFGGQKYRSLQVQAGVKYRF